MKLAAADRGQLAACREGATNDWLAALEVGDGNHSCSRNPWVSMLKRLVGGV